jgi:hypothetical protein
LHRTVGIEKLGSFAAGSWAKNATGFDWLINFTLHHTPITMSPGIPMKKKSTKTRCTV